MDVIYIHSPITYSIAQELIDNGTVSNPVVACGRGIVWDGPHFSVHDDGIWNIERVRDFLVRLVNAMPADASAETLQLRFFVPHTAYLLGKILKLSPAVTRIFYIEEGNTSCDPALASDSQNLEVRADVLLQLLQPHKAVMSRLQLSTAIIDQINSLEAIWFDGGHAKYGGAFRISADAFPTLGNVTTLGLSAQNRLPEGVHASLCFLPNIVSLVSRHGADSMATQKILHGLVIALRTMSAMIANQGGQLIIKFHPVDDANLSADFKDEVFRFGQSYADFTTEHGIDARQEPARLNFDRFMVINESAASRYVRLFHGPDRLINLDLD